MKYLGQISDPKDLVRKEYVDDADTALSTRINTNEDSIAMAESDIESLQGDVNTLKTDNTATKAAVKTLQDTYVPNTRKVNGLALDQDIEIANTLTVTLTKSGSTYTADKTFAEIKSAYDAGKSIQCRNDNIITDLYALTTSPDYLMFTSTNGYTVESRIVYSNGAWDVGSEYLVPATRTINGKSLATDVTLEASDVGALGDDYKPVWTITGDYSFNTNVLSNIDKTYNEIKTAINDGYDVELKLTVGNLGDIVLPYTIINRKGGISFHKSMYFYGKIAECYVEVDISNVWSPILSFALTRIEDLAFDADDARITKVAAPINDTDATTKAYVDTTVEAIDFPVKSVNSKTGAVTLSASDVGALATVSNTTENHIPVFDSNGQLVDSGKELANYVQTTRKINNKTLSSDITLTASDVGAPQQVVDSSGNVVIKTTQDDVIWNWNAESDTYVLGQLPTSSTSVGLRQYIYGRKGSNILLHDYGVILQNADGTTLLDVGTNGSQGQVITAMATNNISLITNKVNIVSVDNGQGVLTNLADPTSALDAVNYQTLQNAIQDFVSATDLVSTETTSAINANTLDNHASSYFATASSVTDLTALVNTINTFINTLAKVATTGSYTDLKNQPTIPTIYSGTTDPSASLGKNGDIYVKYSS